MAFKQLNGLSLAGDANMLTAKLIRAIYKKHRTAVVLMNILLNHSEINISDYNVGF